MNATLPREPPVRALCCLSGRSFEKKVKVERTSSCALVWLLFVLFQLCVSVLVFVRLAGFGVFYALKGLLLCN